MGDPKSLSGLLNGIARQTYYGETDITKEFLKNELYPEMPSNDFEDLMAKMTSLIKSIVTSDMDFNQLEAFLTSQMKRKGGGITEEEKNVFLKFWKNNKVKVHTSMVNKVTWNNSLEDVSWRIDIKTESKNEMSPSEPVAILQLKLKDPVMESSETLQFEMDEQRLQNILGKMNEIEQNLIRVSQQ